MIVAVPIASNIIYFSQCQAFIPWKLWLQNLSAAIKVKFSRDEPLLEILPFVHQILKSVFSACQDLLEYFCPAVLVLSADAGVVETPHEDQSLQR